MTSNLVEAKSIDKNHIRFQTKRSSSMFLSFYFFVCYISLDHLSTSIIIYDFQLWWMYSHENSPPLPKKMDEQNYEKTLINSFILFFHSLALFLSVSCLSCVCVCLFLHSSSHPFNSSFILPKVCACSLCFLAYYRLCCCCCCCGCSSSSSA